MASRQTSDFCIDLCAPASQACRASLAIRLGVIDEVPQEIKDSSQTGLGADQNEGHQASESPWSGLSNGRPKTDRAVRNI